MSLLVPVENIDIPPKWRKAKKAAVASLADSLASEGLLHPIGVRLDEKSGRFLLIFGRHRLEAAKKLGWRDIDATVFAGYSEAGYQAMTDAENLFRNEVSPAERVLALKRWHEGYRNVQPTVADPTDVPAVSPEAPPVAPPKSFRDHVAEVTGMEVKTVERYLYSGKNLTEDQLLTLAANNATHEDVKQINKLKAEQVNAAISLIAGGCSPKEAIAQAKLPPGTTMEIVGDPENPKVEQELTDEEWIVQECGEVLERLKYKVVYLADAILYRHLRDARAKLRNVAKKPLAQARSKATGPFYLMVSKLLNCDHPKNWLPCGPCGSTGMSGSDSKCGTCYGNGYLTRKESK